MSERVRHRVDPRIGARSRIRMSSSWCAAAVRRTRSGPPSSSRTADCDPPRAARPQPALRRLSAQPAQARRPRGGHARQPGGVHDRALRDHGQPRHPGFDRARPRSSTTPATSWPTSSRCWRSAARPRNRCWSSFGRAARPLRELLVVEGEEPAGLADFEGRPSRSISPRPAAGARTSSPSITLRVPPARRRAACSITAGGCAWSISTSGCSAGAGRPPALLSAVLLRRSGDPAHHLARLARHHGGDAALQRLAVLGRGDAA